MAESSRSTADLIVECLEQHGAGMEDIDAHQRPGRTKVVTLEVTG